MRGAATLPTIPSRHGDAAATKIQAVYRAVVCRRHFKLLQRVRARHRRDIAATAIARVWRGRLAKWYLARRRRAVHTAADRIQRWYHEQVERHVREALVRRKVRAALSPTAAPRHRLTTSVTWLPPQLAARRIQGAVRRWRTRTRLSSLIHFASIIIRRRRRLEARKRAALARLKWEHKLHGAICLQRVVRGGLSRAYARLLRRVYTRSAKLIGFWYWGVMDR